MIGVIDYGLGNIRAFANIYRQLNIPVSTIETPDALMQVDKIILPGVGAFDWAMTQLDRSGMRAALDRQVLEKGVPVLGVCVGMQMMAKRSDEGELAGLGWIDAEVLKFDVATLNHRTRLPHMGWNSIAPVDSPLFAGLDDAQFYFLHSYFVRPAGEESVLARANYGIEFAAAVGAGNVYGTQFHPEKSHAWGIRLLKNFAEL